MCHAPELHATDLFCCSCPLAQSISDITASVSVTHCGFLLSTCGIALHNSCVVPWCRQPTGASSSTVPVSKLQQPSAQNQQQQARLAACFCALPDLDPPAAACCFAAPNDAQQEQFDPLDALCCLATSSGGSFSMMHISQQNSGHCVTADSAQAGVGSQQQQKQLSVFQTQPLPEGSPLLDRSMRCSSSSAGSSSRPSSSTGSGLPRSGSKGSSSSGGMTISAAAQPDQTSSAGVASAPSRQRATWQADSKAQPKAAAAAVSTRTAGKLPGASRAPASPKPKPKKPLSDKPVTFHRQIKSSGYGFVQPKVKLGQVGALVSSVSPCTKVLAAEMSLSRQTRVDEKRTLRHRHGAERPMASKRTLSS
jgi:hypothetical protein